MLLLAIAPVLTVFGITPSGQPMKASVLAPDPRIVVVAGLDGSDASIRAAGGLKGVTVLLHKFPENYATPFPPPGDAYAGPHGEAHYLWRFLGLHAPDLILVINTNGAQAPQRLVEALRDHAPAGMGKIPAEIVDGKPGFLAPYLRKKLAQSEARAELVRRLARTPKQVAGELAQHFGHSLEDAVYIPAMAVFGRLRLGHLAEVERIVAPYYNKERSSLTVKPNSSHLSGHLLFGELYRATKRGRYLELSRSAADMAFEADGSPKEAMPLHNEMSDSVFMGCPILAQTGRLTMDNKYYDMALRHFRFMRKLTLRADGIYRHSPLDEAAWGRGNGFPALGMAVTLTELPADHAGHAEILKEFRAHLTALLPHQDAFGAWHQVIDKPESYPELTATAMITFAMARGVARGWLPRGQFAGAIRKGWHAVKSRTAADGILVDVCASTGKQQSLRDYYDRPAILGRDPRGGAMALLLATELMGSKY